MSAGGVTRPEHGERRRERRERLDRAIEHRARVIERLRRIREQEANNQGWVNRASYDEVPENDRDFVLTQVEWATLAEITGLYSEDDKVTVDRLFSGERVPRPFAVRRGGRVGLSWTRLAALGMLPPDAEGAVFTPELDDALEMPVHGTLELDRTLTYGAAEAALHERLGPNLFRPPPFLYNLSLGPPSAWGA